MRLDANSGMHIMNTVCTRIINYTLNKHTLYQTTDREILMTWTELSAHTMSCTASCTLLIIAPLSSNTWTALTCPPLAAYLSGVSPFWMCHDIHHTTDVIKITTNIILIIINKYILSMLNWQWTIKIISWCWWRWLSLPQLRHANHAVRQYL